MKAEEANKALDWFLDTLESLIGERPKIKKFTQDYVDTVNRINNESLKVNVVLN